MAAPAPIVLFDGVCNLCNGAVQFIVDRDRGRFRFAPLQSEAARALLVERGEPDGAPSLDSLIVIEGGALYRRSDAALRIARRLSAPWCALAVLGLAPRVVRDAAYAWVARRRYLWFGRTAACRAPTKELRARFLP
jgi:predicted DCC family thiol-disulfide oxidoreductase YuxK